MEARRDSQVDPRQQHERSASCDASALRVRLALERFHAPAHVPEVLRAAFFAEDARLGQVIPASASATAAMNRSIGKWGPGSV